MKKNTELLKNSIWKIYFTDFTGMMSGKYVFMEEKLGVIGLDENGQAFSTIYPNPVINNTLNIIYAIDGKCNLTIYNVEGKAVYSNIISHNDELNKHSLDVANLQSGVYTLVIKGEKGTTSAKFIKK